MERTVRHSDSLPRLYLAGPLFSDAELEFNCKVKRLLGARFDVYLPQEDGKLFIDLISNGVSPSEAAQIVFKEDLREIHCCSALLAVLDGRVVDEGTAFEIGVAYANGKVCYGLQTDPRRLLPCGNNPMISSALRYVFRSVEELALWVEGGCKAIEGVTDDALSPAP
jgi:nucleoside 2-deoxyribosyltransferase